MNTTKPPLRDVSAELAAVNAGKLHDFGVQITKDCGWDISPDEAVFKYLIERHHWLPRDVRSMSQEDLLLCLKPLATRSTNRA